MKEFSRTYSSGAMNHKGSDEDVENTNDEDKSSGDAYNYRNKSAYCPLAFYTNQCCHIQVVAECLLKHPSLDDHGKRSQRAKISR